MAVLDRPGMREIRDRHLGSYGGPVASVDDVAAIAARLEGLQTGGNAFCYWMLYHFDLDMDVAHDFCVIRKGDYPLYDLRIRIIDMDLPTMDIFNETWGEISAPAELRQGDWSLKPACYFRVLFHARNSDWYQDLLLDRSDSARCWLAATRVIETNGRDEIFRHVDNEFVAEFGEPSWLG